MTIFEILENLETLYRQDYTDSETQSDKFYSIRTLYDVRNAVNNMLYGDKTDFLQPDKSALSA